MTPDITLRQIRGFVALVRHGTFTAAAEALGITQAGLTLLLQALEKRLAVALVDRQARPLVLTEAGKRFIPIAERIIDDVELVAAQASDLKGARGGRIVVAALPTLAAVLLPKAITVFRRRFPEVAIQVRDVLTEEVVNRVRAGDATFGLGAFLEHGEDLTTEFLFRDRLVALGNTSVLRYKSLNWRSLADMQVIMMTRDSNIRQICDRTFMELRLDVRPAFEVGYIGTAAALVAEGLGVAVLPLTEAMPLARKPNRLAHLVDPPAWREIGVLMRRNSSYDVPVRHLIDVLRAAAPAR